MTEKTFSIHSSTGYWVTRLARAMESDFEKRLAAHDMTRASWSVLSAIAHDNNTTPAAIASFIGIDAAAVTRHLDRVEKLGLIQRDHCASDRRSVNLKVTKKGAQVVPKIAADSHLTNKKFLDGLSDAESTQFVAIAKKMLANANRGQGDL